MKCTDGVYQFNYVICGMYGIGKTSLCNRYITGQFDRNTTVTIGVEYRDKILEIDNKNIRVHVYDTGGQERYKAITTSYYRYANGILLCFSLNSIKSFNDLTECLDNIKSLTNQNVQIILVGTFKDSKIQREVSQNKIDDFADAHKLEYVEVSSLSGEGVDQCFNLLHRKILDGIAQNKIDVTYISNIPEIPNKPVKSKELDKYGCCVIS